jgi:transposase
VNWHHFEPKFLPGYSLDFNPIERLWLRLKADWFWDVIAGTREELTERLCTSLKSFFDQLEKTVSVCSIRKLFLRITLLAAC